LRPKNVALRHQVMVLRRQVGGRVHLTNLDRLLLVRLLPLAQASNSERRHHQIPRDPGRTPPSLRSRLGFRYTHLPIRLDNQHDRCDGTATQFISAY
jgi:hypothetical protein